MQGRLSPPVGGRIQAFPWSCWRDEFPLAANLGLGLMEWTLDQEGLRRNPLLTEDGRAEINALAARYSVTVPSITGDCFMQAPLWKASGDERESLAEDFWCVVDGARQVGASIVVVPVVDEGSIETGTQRHALCGFFTRATAKLRELHIRVAFETDMPPDGVLRFLDPLNPEAFGINYDIGNSAAAGFDPREEIACYGARILNVHVKDRELGGGTVPLGRGAADFRAVFESLAAAGYRGNYILQTARDPDGNHAQVLERYFAMTQEWIQTHGS